MPKLRSVLIVATAAFLFAPLAATAGKKKRDSTEYIVDRVVERSPFGFVEGTGNVDMLLVNENGDERKRTIKSKSMREDGQKRTMIRFKTPRDVRGTSILIRENESSENDTFLYLPAYKRTRRIAGGDKRNAFVGSDFSYSDMEHQDIRDARHKRKSDVKIDGHDCYHIVAYPDDKTAYSKLDIYVRKKDYLAQRIKYYDGNGDVVKIFRVLEVKRFDGEEVATKSQMWAKKKNHSTFFIVKKLDTKRIARPSEFDKSALASR